MCNTITPKGKGLRWWRPDIDMNSKIGNDIFVTKNKIQIIKSSLVGTIFELT